MGSVTGALRRLLSGKLAATVGYSALAIGVIAILFWRQAFNLFGLDDWVERSFLRYASPGVSNYEATELRLVIIDPADNGDLGPFTGDKWRGHHAELIGRLRSVGAKAVAFDMFFPSPHQDQADENVAFANAIREARMAGDTIVIVGLNKQDYINDALTAVVPREEMGLVNIRRTTESADKSAFDTRIILAEAFVADSVIYDERLVQPIPIPLAIYLAHFGLTVTESSIEIDSRRGQLVIEGPGIEPIRLDVEVETCRVSELGCRASFGAPKPQEEYLVRALMPFWVQGTTGFNTRAYDAVLHREDISDFAGKTAIVGAMTEHEKVNVGELSETSTIYGFHVVAQVVSDLINRTYPRKVKARWQFLLLLPLIAAGVIARLKLPVREIPVPIVSSMPMPFGFIVFSAAFLVLAILFFRSTWLLLDVNYHVLAVAAGYFLVARRGKWIEDES